MLKMVKKFLYLLVVVGSFAMAEGFTLKSPDISGQMAMEQVFKGFGCKGENISPELSWESAPKGTKSFAITVYDKDAPTGAGWWHWVVFDIPNSVSSLAKGSGDSSSKNLPKGAIQVKTSFGSAGYGGACPPVGHGAHQYLFTVHALDTDKLGLDGNATPSLVGYMLNMHTIQKASISAYYSR